MLRTVRTLTAVAAAVTALAAQAQTFSFTGSGAVVPTAPPSLAGDLPLTVTATAYDLPGPLTWTLQSNFIFNILTGTGAGSFSFSDGVSSSLSGSLTTVAATVAGGSGFELTYTVTGGTGTYAGLTGSGSSLVRLLNDLNSPPPYDYLESGLISLVPEPSSAWLLLGGALGLAAWRRLQRENASADGR